MEITSFSLKLNEHSCRSLTRRRRISDLMVNGEAVHGGSVWILRFSPLEIVIKIEGMLMPRGLQAIHFNETLFLPRTEVTIVERPAPMARIERLTPPTWTSPPGQYWTSSGTATYTYSTSDHTDSTGGY